MKQPLALLIYEKLLPGSQLIQKLQDKGYRVQPLPGPGDLIPTAEREKPLVIFVDLEPQVEVLCGAIAALRANAITSHVPIVAFAEGDNTAAHQSAGKAGATLAVNGNALLMHLNQFLDRALEVE